MNDYRKKPVTVEARQFVAAGAPEQEKLAAWCHGNLIGAAELKPSERLIQIYTLEGVVTASVGDYIIKGVAGEFYPCKPEIFAQTYEEVGSSGDREFVLARLLSEAEKHVPEIKLPENAFVDGYSVELGEHRFTQAQWEAIQLYAAGTAELALTEEEDARATLNRMQAQVREFHEGMGQPVGTEARALPKDRVAVRVELIREEFQDELIPALEAGDLVETADACIDILYVTFGLLVEMGIDATPLFDEVQRSNMSKFGADGKAIIAGPNDPDGVFEGRVKKGPNYFKPNLADLLFSGNADLGRQ